MTPKQVAFLWMYSKLDDAKVNPELHEFEELAGKKLPASTIKAAEAKVREEIARWRPRYSDYLSKQGILPK